MSIQHASLTGAELHEPKGIAGQAAGKIYIANGAGSGVWTALTGIVQTVNSQTGAVATGTTITPYDDTIPQITEGTQFMTLAITPTDVDHKLLIEVIAYYSSATNINSTLHLHQDATANALAAVGFQQHVSTASMQPFYLRHYMTAGTTSSTTFRVRIGPASADTITFNGTAGARRFGGVCNSSITITEIRV